MSKDIQGKFRVPPTILVFTAAYFVATGVSAVLNENAALPAYMLSMVVLAGVVILVHLHVNLSRPVLWCLSVWGLLHLAGGLVQIPEFFPYNSSSETFYSLWFVPRGLRYDQAVHAFGFGITVQLSWELLRNSVASRYGLRLVPGFGMVAICCLAGMGLGAVNEVLEFAATALLTHIDAGGYENLGWDLIYNTIGVLVAGVIIFLRGRFGPGRESVRREVTAV